MIEALSGLALIVGLFTRVVGLLLAVEMLLAAVVVYLPNGFFAGGGGYELVRTPGLGALTLLLTGLGAAALPIEHNLAGRDHSLPSGRRA